LKKDLRRVEKQGGNFAGHRDCHVQPDWLLLYRVTETELILVRTGSHAELFD
jgi:mRNA interferase YafQ